MMKQLVLLLVSLFFDISSMTRTLQSPKNKLKNMTSYFADTPRTFGTTHFIVGYKENPHHKPSKNKSTFQHAVLDNATQSACVDRNCLVQSFFTTVHDLSPIVLSMIEETEKTLYLAAFNFTDKRIADALIKAHQRGVDVCVIVDASNKTHPHSKIRLLMDADIPVWWYKPSLNPKYKKGGLSEPCMHHKVMVGDNFVTFGSANFTKAGQKDNIENFNIIREKKIINDYRAELDRLKKWCVKCSRLIDA